MAVYNTATTDRTAFARNVMAIDVVLRVMYLNALFAKELT